ncbi:conjugal transfer protein TraB [Streptomyces sp. NPDC053048]|uniref:conjugal transfer protein TraB n=1 Tax=Streptomyces sp. NPDC053048 TaxID=3365694 RepID=UPI0037D491DD
MTDLIPYTAPQLPARGEKLSFMTLAAKVTTLTASALALKERLHLLQRRMEKDAADADRIAEMCAEAEVEPRFTALIHEAAKALRNIAKASGSLAGAADAMAAHAQGFDEAHEREYRGIYERVQASDVQQAKPGFYRKR